MMRPPAYLVQWVLAFAGWVGVACAGFFWLDPALRARPVAWFFVAVLLAGALAIAWWQTRRLLTTLTRVDGALKSVIGGRYDQTLFPTGRDELGALESLVEELRMTVRDRLATLTSQSNRASAVLDSMVEGVLAVDADQRLLLVNDAARTLLDIPGDAQLGQPLMSVVRRRAIHDAVERALEDERPVETEFELDAAGRPRRTLTLRVSLLASDIAEGLGIVVRDITALRKLENFRREFVANVSHELKTPLAAIRAYAETMRMDDANQSPSVRELAGRIEEQADRLDHLLVDMLQLARIESGREAFQLADIDITSAVSEMVNEYVDVASRKKITLHMAPPDEPVRVRADPPGFRAVLGNLIENAIKYTGEGGQVAVRWRPVDHSVRVEVEDTGIGIAPEDQARVFERFYRVDKARATELGGAGLGLAIVKHMVQVFHGECGVESEPGVGSRFWFRLPTV